MVNVYDYMVKVELGVWGKRGYNISRLKQQSTQLFKLSDRQDGIILS